MSSFYGKLNDFPPEQIRQIHEASLKILAQVGVLLDHPLVLEKLTAFGARVDFDKRTARFPGDLVEDAVFHFKNACDRGRPPETLRFAAGGEADRINDLVAGRPRKPTLKDLEDATRLADVLPYIDEVDSAVFVPETPAHVADLHTYRTLWRYTEKPGGGGLSRNGNALRNYTDKGLEYLLRLAAIKLGGEAQLRARPFIGGFVGFASPLRIGRLELQQMVKLIEMGQYVGIGSNVIAGGQAPATICGVVTMENAERLGGLMAALSIDPAARVYFTNHPHYLDMRSGDIANGSTEHVLAALLGRAVLEYYGLNRHFISHPAVLTGSHLHDEQAGLEKMMGMLMAGLAGHKGVIGMGMLNSSFSLCQLVIDNAMAGMVKRLLRGVCVSPEEIDLDLMLKIGIGGNALEYPDRIMNQVRKNFLDPGILSRCSHATWSQAGEKSLVDRARETAVAILAEPPREYLRADQLAEMDDLIAEAEVALLPAGV